MQYELKYTKTFRRSYKRAKKRGLDLSLLGEVVEMLRCGKELPEKYSDHWLTGGLFQMSRMPYQTRLASDLSH